MARAYSLDLRKRVVAAVASGQTCWTVAERFGVSVASVVKWSQRFRATGSAAAKPTGGRRPYALEGERHWVLTRVSEAPDLTLRALAAELAQRGITVSHYAVWHFLLREGINRVAGEPSCAISRKVSPRSNLLLVACQIGCGLSWTRTSRYRQRPSVNFAS
jgi:transposase